MVEKRWLIQGVLSQCHFITTYISITVEDMKTKLFFWKLMMLSLRCKNLNSKIKEINVLLNFSQMFNTRALGYTAHIETSLLLKFRVPFLYDTSVWWLLWKSYPKFTLTTCRRVVFIKFQNTKRFLHSSKRHFKQIRCKSVETAFYAKSLKLDCDVAMVWRNHCSNKIGDFTFPTKPILSCYFCQLLRYEIF